MNLDQLERQAKARQEAERVGMTMTVEDVLELVWLVRSLEEENRALRCRDNGGTAAERSIRYRRQQ